MKRLTILIVILFMGAGCLDAMGAEKRSLTIADFDSWKTLENVTLSVDGRWLLFSEMPQEGDGRLVLKPTHMDTAFFLSRAYKARASAEGHWAAALIKPAFQETRRARIAKKKESEMPRDSLAVIRLSPLQISKIADVKSFQFPEKNGGWMAYHLHQVCKKETSKSSLIDSLQDGDEPTAGSKSDSGSTLVIRHLDSERQWFFPRVSEFLFDKPGAQILFATAANDSIPAGIFCFSTRQEKIDTLLSARGCFKKLTWDEDGARAAFLADLDTTKNKPRFYRLYLWHSAARQAQLLADTLSPGMKKDWMVSEHGELRFAKEGRSLFFATTPIPPPEDTTLIEFENAKVDIWHWQDPFLQTQQLKDLDKELKRSYAAVMRIGGSSLVQLADEAIPEIRTATEGDPAWCLGLSDLPYRKQLSWEGALSRDVYAIRLKDGQRIRVAREIRGAVEISPYGRYIYWFDEREQHWFAYDTRSQKTANLTATLKTPLGDERNDVPDFPRGYGAMGWRENDEHFYIYDRYDIWQLDPQNSRPPLCLTAAQGRTQQLHFRNIRLDPEEKFLGRAQQLLLKVFHEPSKREGFFRMTLGDPASLQQLFLQEYSLDTVLKAKEAERYVFSRGSFQVFPDLWMCDASFTALRRVSDANPQQNQFYWGSVEPLQWLSDDGTPLEGLLYKPEDFDSTHQYPLIVYFYERNAHLLNRYQEPRPSPSTIRPCFYTSRGYMVFIPDIVYQEGHPGESALKCILPGVQKLIQTGHVDPQRMGLQGQSWGGYQVAFLVTRTPLFRCAMAGAPVSNMSSAYGGIRWESGMSRMFQYERSQSRIGGTLWEKPLLYLENSPLFRLPDVKTPLLIMHNDGDGAVPWYQGIELFVGLRRLGKPAWLLNYNGEKHNLEQRQNRKDLSRRMQQFFDHYLMGTPEPSWMKQGVPAMQKGKSWGFETE